MSGAAVILVFIVVRALLSQSGGSGSVTNISPAIWALIVRAFWLIVTILVYVNDAPATVYGPLLLLTFPAPLIQLVLIPLGVPWLAYYATRWLRPFGFGPENRAGAVFNELRARVRWGLLLGPQRLQVLSRLLRQCSNTGLARGASVAARAMLEELKGDRETALALFNLGQDLKHSTRGLRCYCQAWLLADAAARADYAEVLRLSKRGPRSARRRFMRACAEQLLGIRRRSALALKLLWLLAPGRPYSLELLRFALAAAPVVQEPPEIGAGLAGARDAAVELAQAAPGLMTPERVWEVAWAWQLAFDDGLVRAWLAERMTALEWSSDAHVLAERLEQDIAQLLSEAWRKTLPQPQDEDEDEDEPWLLQRAQDTLQDELLSDIEPLVEELPTGEQISDQGIEFFFRRWAEIRFRAQHYLDLFPDRSAIFYDSFGTTLLNHGSWLHNIESAYPLSHEIFRWLRGLLPAGHEDQPLLTENQKLSLGAARGQ